MQKNFIFYFSSFLLSLTFFLLTEKNINGPIFFLYSMDNFFYWLTFLTCAVLLLSNNYLKTYENYKLWSFFMFFTWVVFLFCFSVDSIFIFYMMFELSVIPLMFFISTLGYSLERIKATFYMFIYTYIFSLPFLIAILLYSKNMSTHSMMMTLENTEINSMMGLTMILMILVKAPMWGLHSWLLKAHVEASTEGSMLLASIVLKLSGMAMFKICYLTFNFDSNVTYNLIISICLMGSILMSLYIMRQTDVKLMVAISSIVHMSFMVITFFYWSSLSTWALGVIMVSHGLCSPLMFLFVGECYSTAGTRVTHHVKGFLKTSLMILSLWFFCIIFNMAVPISMNFLGEILFFFNMATFSNAILIFSSMLVLFSGLYNTFMFTIFYSGKNEFLNLFKLQLKTSFLLLVYFICLIIFIVSSSMW